MAISPLPTPPSRDDAVNFAARADAFQNPAYVASVVALPRFRCIMWTSLSTTNTAYEGAGKSREIFNAAFDTTPPAGAYYVQTHLDSHVGVQGAADANPTLYADTVHLNGLGVPYHVATCVPAVTTAWAA